MYSKNRARSLTRVPRFKMMPSGRGWWVAFPIAAAVGARRCRARRRHAARAAGGVPATVTMARKRQRACGPHVSRHGRSDGHRLRDRGRARRARRPRLSRPPAARRCEPRARARARRDRAELDLGSLASVRAAAAAVGGDGSARRRRAQRGVVGAARAVGRRLPPADRGRARRPLRAHPPPPPRLPWRSRADAVDAADGADAADAADADAADADAAPRRVLVLECMHPPTRVALDYERGWRVPAGGVDGSSARAVAGAVRERQAAQRASLTSSTAARAASASSSTRSTQPRRARASTAGCRGTRAPSSSPSRASSSSRPHAPRARTARLATPPPVRAPRRAPCAATIPRRRRDARRGTAASWAPPPLLARPSEHRLSRRDVTRRDICACSEREGLPPRSAEPSVTFANSSPI